MSVIFALSLFICLVMLTGLMIIAFMHIAEVRMTKAKALLLMGSGVTLMILLSVEVVSSC